MRNKKELGPVKPYATPFSRARHGRYENGGTKFEFSPLEKTSITSSEDSEHRIKKKVPEALCSFRFIL